MTYGYRVRFKRNNEEFQERTEDYLIHYGVKGQKWGVRNYQNLDGTMTAEGLERYRREHGLPATRMVQNPKTTMAAPRRAAMPSRVIKNPSNPVSKPVKPKRTPAQIKARKSKAKKIIAISAGVTLAAALGYAAYRGSTNLRDNMRKEIFENMSKGHDSINTLSSKYWNSADRSKYNALVKERAKFVADNTTRTDALVAKFYEKTGLRLNLPQSRSKVLAERRSQQQLSNFIRDAEKRGHLNKSIHDARANLRAAQDKLSRYSSTEHIGVSKQYEQLWKQKYADNVKMYKEQLDKLLLQRGG